MMKGSAFGWGSKRFARLLSLVLVILMFCSLVPVGALAADDMEQPTGDSIAGLAAGAGAESDPTLEEVSYEPPAQEEPAPAQEEPAAEPEDPDPAPADPAEEPEDPADEDDDLPPDAGETPTGDNIVPVEEGEMEDVEAPTEENAPASETMMDLVEDYKPPLHFEADCNGLTVIVDAPEGTLPFGTGMRVAPVRDNEVLQTIGDELGADASRVTAVDISFLYEEEEIEPDGYIFVTLKSQVIEASADAQVVHMDNYGATQVVEQYANYAPDEVSFVADSFSVYAIVDGGETVTYRRTYKFINEVDSEGNTSGPYYFYNKAGEKVDTQILAHNGETLEPVGEPYESGKTFLGWYEVTESGGKYTYTDNEVEFDTAVSDISSLTADETVYVAPKYEAVYYVTFHQTAQGSAEDIIQTKKVVYVSGSDANRVLISDVIAPQPVNTKIFIGWLDGETEYDVYDDNHQSVVETYIENVTEDKDLYPVFADAYWLRFVSGETGWRASYVASEFVLANEKKTQLPVPSRPGYDFIGWYTGSMTADGHIAYDEGGQVTDETGTVINPADGLQLTGTTILYAMWNARPDATYTVVLWRQKVSDPKDAADSAKTYDYVDSFVREGYTGAPASPSSEDISHSGGDYTGFHYARTVQNSETINANGSTVVNVYYDRDLMAVNFYYQNGHQPTGAQTAYTYTQTTSDSGEQYGVDASGVYHRLTRGSGSSTTRVYYEDSLYGDEYTGTFYTRGGWWPLYTYTATQYNGGNLPPAGDGTTYYTADFGFWNGGHHELSRKTETTTTYHWTMNGEPYTGTRYTRSQMSSYPYMVTWTGLYGQSFAQNGYTWPAGYKWNEQSDGRGTTQTFLSAFNSSDNPYNLYDRGSTGNYYIYHYKQGLDGKYHETEGTYRFTARGGGGNFTFEDKFDGFSVTSYRNNYNGNGGGTSALNADGTPKQQQDVSYPLHVYHERNKWKIDYMAPNDAGNMEMVHSTGDHSVYFEAPLADYNLTLEQAGLEERDHYTFRGWYADEGCNTPFNFNGTMPNANVVVYAKYEKNWYQIIVDPDGGVITPDIGSTYFWKQYEDTFDKYDIERNYIEDPEGDYMYVYVDGRDDPDGNINVRTATYELAPADYTGTRYRPITTADPKYELLGWYVVDEDGNTTSTPWDFNAEVEEPVWIRAVWSLSGSYRLAYDAVTVVDGVTVSGTISQTDAETDYADGATTTVQAPPSNVTKGYVFDGWEVVDAQRNTLDDNGGKYYQAGEEITLNAAHWADSMKVIHLQAHYTKVEESSDPTAVTTLILDANGGTTSLSDGQLPHENKPEDSTDQIQRTVNAAKTQVTYYPLHVNEPFDLNTVKSAFTKDGAVLIGWHHEKAKADAGVVEFKPDTVVGADNLPDDANTLYAVWAYEIIVTKDVEGNMGDVNKKFAITVTADKTIKYVEGETETDVTSKDLNLADSERAKFIVPNGVKLTVTESDYSASGYTTTYSFTPANGSASALSGALTVTEGGTVTVTNTKDVTVDTGVPLDSLPFILIIALTLLSSAAMLVSYKRRRGNER